jgi:SAM-dependent methyltransferase
LLDLAGALHLGDRVEYLGVLPGRGQLLNSCARADVGLALFPRNGQPMAGASNKPFDYLAGGLALLVSDLPDWRDLFVVPGYGFACDPEDEHSIVAKLRWYLDHAAETRAMGNRGAHRIMAEWNYEHMFFRLSCMLNATRPSVRVSPPKPMHDEYLDSGNRQNEDVLAELERRMSSFYFDSRYHAQWINGINANWCAGPHDAQLAMCARIPAGARLLEVGCGDGSCAAEIATRVPRMQYVGIDINPKAKKTQKGFEFHQGSATTLPFPDSSFDVILSMFLIEHLVFPRDYLDEAWRVLRSPGQLLTIAPDFRDSPMNSERIGRSYGTGREKLRRGRIIDAICTAYDTRWRIRRLRQKRISRLAQGDWSFPILTNPRCFRLPGFVPDCDAIYPVCPEELINYLRRKPGYGRSEIFFRARRGFGLLVTKH